MALCPNSCQWHDTYLAVALCNSIIQVHNSEYAVICRTSQLKSSILSVAFSSQVNMYCFPILEVLHVNECVGPPTVCWVQKWTLLYVGYSNRSIASHISKRTTCWRQNIVQCDRSSSVTGPQLCHIQCLKFKSTQGREVELHVLNNIN